MNPYKGGFFIEAVPENAEGEPQPYFGIGDRIVSRANADLKATVTNVRVLQYTPGRFTSMPQLDVACRYEYLTFEVDGERANLTCPDCYSNEYGRCMDSEDCVTCRGKKRFLQQVVRHECAQHWLLIEADENPDFAASEISEPEGGEVSNGESGPRVEDEIDF